MNKKQREAKRKNAQAHQKKVKDLAVQREHVLIARRKELPGRGLFKPSRVISSVPISPIDTIMLSHGFATLGAFIPLEQRPEIPASVAKELEVLLALADLCPTCSSK